MDANERQELAQHLAEMKLKKARSEIRRLDKDAALKTYRNAIGSNEWHTIYDLPNMGIRISLVEEPTKSPIYGSHLVRSKPVYVEARVEPLKR